MARLPRFTLPGYPHHVIQRGNNRQAIFVSPENHQTLLDLMAESAKRFEVDVHAYVLMNNHFHLLLTPHTETGLPLMMQAVGRRYVRYFNDLQGRSGTLWEGRYRSTVIEAERFLLACMAYIDLNPVRAGLVAQARDYPWSSYGHYTGQRIDKLITPHSLFWELGNTPFAREAAYADMVQAGLNMVQQTALTDSALNGWALGSPEFVDDLQKKTRRRLSKSSPGRPTSTSKNSDK
jgi:putative transposase